MRGKLASCEHVVYVYMITPLVFHGYADDTNLDAAMQASLGGIFPASLMTLCWTFSKTTMAETMHGAGSNKSWALFILSLIELISLGI